jgi:hypothetical protein
MIPPIFSLYGSSFACVSKDESQYIHNFLSPKEIASTIHHVNKTWLRLWGNNGHLDFSDCPDLTNEDLERILMEYAQCATLISLNLSGCTRITGDVLKVLNRFPLKRLNLSMCYIEDEELSYLRRSQLTHLNLSNCPITNDGLVHLQKLSLTHLNLSRTDITGEGFVCLKIPSLIKLNVARCYGLKGRGLVHLAGLALEALNLCSCAIEDDDLVHLRCLPHLRKLDLSCNPHIDGSGLVHLSDLSLTVLVLQRCVALLDEALFHLRRLPLVYLNLNLCIRITDDGLAHIEHLKRLECLYLAHSNVTNFGLFYLKNLNLRELDLTSCEIADEGLKCLKLDAFTSINLTACTDISEEGFAHVLNSPIKCLNASYCRITERVLTLIAKLPLLQANLFSAKILCKDRISK